MMNLRIDKVVLVRDSYQEVDYVLWEEGNFCRPIAFLTEIETDKLLEQIQAAKKRPGIVTRDES
jgi:hypothetical protein